ncbi:MAG: hypothetical protein F6J97_13465 [Leptolyngbya sp. SIO4C1]|nr:hypothetical protein [Leptolyngbya sp. SIO4C1]
MPKVSPSLPVRSLLCHKHVDMALLCFKSFYQYAAEPIKLIIHDDGSLTSADVDRLTAALPDVSILPRREIDEQMDERLQDYPTARQSRYQNPLRLKLLDVPLLSEGDIRFCDSDILFLQPFQHLFDWPSADTSAVFMVDSRPSYSVSPQRLLLDHSLRLPRKINGGLYMMRQEAYDLEFVEWFLSQPSLMGIPNWATQTCYAAMAYRTGCRCWDPQQVLVVKSQDSILPETVAAHFVGPVRHLLKNYSPESPTSAVDSESAAATPAVAIKTVATDACRLHELVHAQLRRHIKVGVPKLMYQLRSSPVAKLKRNLADRIAR